MRPNAPNEPRQLELLLDPSASSASAALDRVPHERHGMRTRAHDDLRRNAQHLVPEPCELPVPARVRMLLCVDLAIDLNDQPQRGREEVSDVAIPEHDLSPKRDAEGGRRTSCTI